jgi:probable rRNA maturation factor
MSPDAPADDCPVLFRALPRHLKFSQEEKRSLITFAHTLTRHVVDGRPFTCLITGDRELHRLNRLFLANDHPTDVLSFPASGATLSLGEMAISVDRAEAQALAFGHSRIDEIQVLMLHGLLHLAGMDHKHDCGEMARAEREWRAHLNLPETLIARASASSGILSPSHACRKRVCQ